MAISGRLLQAAAIATLIWSLTAMLSVTPASAALQFYSLTVSGAPCDPTGFQVWGCSPGTSTTGVFAVDTSILSTDGWNYTAGVSDFFLPFGSLGNYYADPNTSLGGACLPQIVNTITGPVMFDGTPPCNLFDLMRSSGPFGVPGGILSLLIEGGEVVAIGGGPVGRGDSNSVFFSPFIGPGDTQVTDEYIASLCCGPNDVGSFGIGTYVIDPIPEPGSLALFGIGVVGLALARRRSLKARGRGT